MGVCKIRVHKTSPSPFPESYTHIFLMDDSLLKQNVSPARFSVLCIRTTSLISGFLGDSESMPEYASAHELAHVCACTLSIFSLGFSFALSTPFSFLYSFFICPSPSFSCLCKMQVHKHLDSSFKTMVQRSYKMISCIPLWINRRQLWSSFIRYKKRELKQTSLN